ncbi:hypothetical protein NM208_g2349 [Fusarium decemcellulare]|uniref:Uncharacterized protein n=1 Tax=Fusarium decemcellulare TaxID=57161 RepID=A0ACC1STE4_9HYPO|nr:hypothetical protein NM208_g2349 [Fusarium decemcellulare]
MVVLSSDQVVKDLLDKRSSIYSSRPDMYIASDVLSGGLRFLLMGYNSRWRVSRKLTHQLLNVQISKKYVIYQDLEIVQLCHDLLKQPADFVKHLRRFTTSLSATMIFGFRCPSYQDHEIENLYHAADSLSDVGRSVMASMMDFYPILRYIPDIFNPITSQARQVFVETLQLYRRYWALAKKNQSLGVGVHSFCQDLSAIQARENISDDDAAFMAGMLLEGGSDSTSVTLMGFIQAMALSPEVQRRGQEEVDKVVGQERLPNLDDWDDLPYTRACVKEILRWLPVATLGMIHATTTNDIYNGYEIPKGAQVVNNIWAINMDEQRFSDPKTFNPDRYLGDELSAAESAALTDGTKRDHFSFGAGRRICQGIHVAERSLLLAISRFLWAFDISKARGRDGQEIDITPHQFSIAIILTLDPFQCDIRPRGPKRMEVVECTWTAAKEQFQNMGLDT